MKIMKTFVLGMAVSSISIGSAQLTGSTYGAFNNNSEVKMEITSCSIFPGPMNDLSKNAIDLVKEIVARQVKITKMSEELGFDDMAVKMEKLSIVTEGGKIGNSTPGDSDITESSLLVKKGLYELEIEQSNRIHETNVAKLQELLDLKDEIEGLYTNIRSLAEDLEILIKDTNKSLEHVAETIKKVEDAQGEVEDVCMYDDNFFPDILADLYDYEEKNKEVEESLDLEKTNLEQKMELVNEWENEIVTSIANLESENSRLTENISAKMEQISQIETQIQEEAIGKQNEDDALKKVKEEKPKNEGNPEVIPGNEDKQDLEDDEETLNPEKGLEKDEDLTIPKPIEEARAQVQ